MLGNGWTSWCGLRIFPGGWNARDGGDLFRRRLHNGIRIRLDVVLTARPRPRGRPGHAVTREPAHGRALTARPG